MLAHSTQQRYHPGSSTGHAQPFLCLMSVTAIGSMRCILLAVLCCSLRRTESACLEGAIPPEQRKTVAIDGVPMPLGVFVLEWQTATL